MINDNAREQREHGRDGNTLVCVSTSESASFNGGKVGAQNTPSVTLFQRLLPLGRWALHVTAVGGRTPCHFCRSGRRPRVRRVRRGDIYVATVRSAYTGKPGPVVIVQDDRFDATASCHGRPADREPCLGAIDPDLGGTYRRDGDRITMPRGKRARSPRSSRGRRRGPARPRTHRVSRARRMIR